MIRKKISKLPRNGEGSIHTQVTDKYFNKLTQYLSCLRRILQYDAANGGELAERTMAPELLSRHVMSQALLKKYEEQELVELRKEYFSPTTGKIRKDADLSKLQERLQTTVQYIVSRRPVEDEAQKPGSKRVRAKTGRSSKGGSKKKKRKLMEAPSSNSNSSSDDEEKGKKALVTVSEYSQLDDTGKRKAVNDYLRVKGGRFKYAKNGNCKFGKNCRFEHIKLPDFMAKKKKKNKSSGKNTSSTSTSSKPKDFAKQTKMIVKQMLADERKKKGDE